MQDTEIRFVDDMEDEEYLYYAADILSKRHKLLDLLADAYSIDDKYFEKTVQLMDKEILEQFIIKYGADDIRRHIEEKYYFLVAEHIIDVVIDTLVE